jgi:hypothetical protein
MELLVPTLIVLLIAILAQAAGKDSRDLDPNACRPA